MVYFSLKDDGKEWIKKYGGSVIDKLKFRDSFVMIGQRGLTHGSAIEKVSLSSSHHLCLNYVYSKKKLFLHQDFKSSFNMCCNVVTDHT